MIWLYPLFHFPSTAWTVDVPPRPPRRLTSPSPDCRTLSLAGLMGSLEMYSTLPWAASWPYEATSWSPAVRLLYSSALRNVGTTMPFGTVKFLLVTPAAMTWYWKMAMSLSRGSDVGSCHVCLTNWSKAVLLGMRMVTAGKLCGTMLMTRFGNALRIPANDVSRVSLAMAPRRSWPWHAPSWARPRSTAPAEKTRMLL